LSFFVAACALAFAYVASAQEVIMTIEKMTGVQSRDAVVRRGLKMPGSLEIRGAYLDGTKIEEEMQRALNTRGVHCLVYSMNHGKTTVAKHLLAKYNKEEKPGSAAVYIHAAGGIAAAVRAHFGLDSPAKEFTRISSALTSVNPLTWLLAGGSVYSELRLVIDQVDDARSGISEKDEQMLLTLAQVASQNQTCSVSVVVLARRPSTGKRVNEINGGLKIATFDVASHHPAIPVKKLQQHMETLLRQKSPKDSDAAIAKQLENAEKTLTRFPYVRTVEILAGVAGLDEGPKQHVELSTPDGQTRAADALVDLAEKEGRKMRPSVAFTVPRGATITVCGPPHHNGPAFSEESIFGMPSAEVLEWVEDAAATAGTALKYHFVDLVDKVGLGASGARPARLRLPVDVPRTAKWMEFHEAVELRLFGFVRVKTPSAKNPTEDDDTLVDVGNVPLDPERFRGFLTDAKETSYARRGVEVWLSARPATWLTKSFIEPDQQSRRGVVCVKSANGKAYHVDVGNVPLDPERFRGFLADAKETVYAQTFVEVQLPRDQALWLAKSPVEPVIPQLDPLEQPSPSPVSVRVKTWRGEKHVDVGVVPLDPRQFPSFLADAKETVYAETGVEVKLPAQHATWFTKSSFASKLLRCRCVSRPGSVRSKWTLARYRWIPVNSPASSRTPKRRCTKKPAWK